MGLYGYFIASHCISIFRIIPYPHDGPRVRPETISTGALGKGPRPISRCNPSMGSTATSRTRTADMQPRHETQLGKYYTMITNILYHPCNIEPQALNNIRFSEALATSTGVARCIAFQNVGETRTASTIVWS